MVASAGLQKRTIGLRREGTNRDVYVTIRNRDPESKKTQGTNWLMGKF